MLKRILEEIENNQMLLNNFEDIIYTYKNGSL
jgi:hypothetical protein